MKIYRYKVVSSPFDHKGIWFFKTLYGRFVKVNTGKYIYVLKINRKEPISHKQPDTSDTLVFEMDDTGEIVIRLE